MSYFLMVPYIDIDLFASLYNGTVDQNKKQFFSNAFNH